MVVGDDEVGEAAAINDGEVRVLGVMHKMRVTGAMIGRVLSAPRMRCGIMARD